MMRVERTGVCGRAADSGVCFLPRGKLGSGVGAVG